MNKIIRTELQEHGSWIEKMGGNGWNEWTNLICSECNTKFEKIDWPSKYRFCPYCGKRMDKEN